MPAAGQGDGEGERDARRDGPGSRPRRQFEAFAAGFDDPDMRYAPFVFWFWDAPLEDTDPAEMAETMLEQNLDPGYVHARTTLEVVDAPSLDPGSEWLSEEWFEAFGDALDAVVDDGAYLGYVDEYMWPSMQAGGRVLEANPDLEGEYLRWRTVDVPAGATVEVPESHAAVAAPLVESLERDDPVVTAADERHEPRAIRAEDRREVAAGEWTAPAAGDWRLYVFSRATHEGTPNYLDDRLADAFAEVALDPYDERFADELGASIPGDFVDNEGSYGDLLAWSASLADRYAAETDAALDRDLPLLVDEDAAGRYASVRVRWFEAVSALYAENYARTTAWHERRGMYTTGHFWEESLASQARWVGSHFAMQRSLSMPGQDCLGDSALEVHDFKEAQSVAEFEGARYMTELLGAGAGADPERPWGTFRPPFVKRATNAALAWGASHVIPHGVFATRELEDNPWPPDWYTENPWYPQMHLWADFVRRASYVHSHGDQVADVLLVNPMATVWAHSGFELFDETLAPEGVEEFWDAPEVRPSGERINAVDEAYSSAMADLTAANVEYLIADGHYLDELAVEDGRLVGLDRAFETVVLPPMDVLSRERLEAIRSFAASGGRVYALGDLPRGSTEAGMDDPRMADLGERLADEPTVSFVDDVDAAVGRPGLEPRVSVVDGSADLLVHHRQVDGRDVVWLANDADEATSATVRIRGVAGATERWHPETGERVAVGSRETGAGSEVPVAFDPYEGYWLVFDPAGQPTPIDAGPGPTVETLDVDVGPWRVRRADEQPPREHPVETPTWLRGAGAERALGSWHDDWDVPEAFTGRLDYESSVTVPDVDGSVVLDLGEVYWSAAAWVNGEPVGERLWGPHEFDVGDALVAGENTVRVRVANLVNNNYGDVRESGLLGPVTLRVERDGSDGQGPHRE